MDSDLAVALSADPYGRPEFESRRAAKRRTRRPVGAVLVGAAIGAGLTLAGVYGIPQLSSSGTVTVHGELILRGTANIVVGQNDTCEGSGGYSDLAPGASVAITDQTGHTLSTVPLADGAIAAVGECQFTFTTSVPANSKTYGVTISHRGTVIYTKTQVAAPVLTIGNY